MENNETYFCEVNRCECSGTKPNCSWEHTSRCPSRQRPTATEPEGDYFTEMRNKLWHCKKDDTGNLIQQIHAHGAEELAKKLLAIDCSTLTETNKRDAMTKMIEDALAAIESVKI